MKSLFSFIALICIIVLTYAQAPQKLSYQAVLRNSTNELIGQPTSGYANFHTER